MSKLYSKIVTACLAISIVGLILTGCLSKPAKITITGSTTVLPIAQKCAETFMAKKKNIRISVSGGGSSVGIAALIDGSCDIADASRQIKDKEVQKAEEKGIKPFEYVVAKDALAIVVNKSVTGIEDLPISTIKDIFNGKIKNWNELGGPDAEIVLISRDTSSGTFETFEGLVMKSEKIVPEALMLASNNAVATTVATTPNSIGYIGLGYLSSADVKAIKMDGVAPSNETVLNGQYKISRNLHMYTNGEATGAVKKFLDFVLSAEGQKIVEEEGFVPLPTK